MDETDAIEKRKGGNSAAHLDRLIWVEVRLERGAVGKAEPQEEDGRGLFIKCVVWCGRVRVSLHKWAVVEGGGVDRSID